MKIIISSEEESECKMTGGLKKRLDGPMRNMKMHLNMGVLEKALKNVLSHRTKRIFKKSYLTLINCPE